MRVESDKEGEHQKLPDFIKVIKDITGMPFFDKL